VALNSDLELEYLGEFATVFENVLGRETVAQGKMFDGEKKHSSKIS
jgi:hypothetical protein